jgi:hypothetical protein
MNQFSGIEDITVKNGADAHSGRRDNILVSGAANSWVKNVRVDTCGKRCIDLFMYHYRVEVRDNYITGCLDRTNSDTCYGIEIANGSNSLIENNIIDGTSNGPTAMWGASGNVIAYNYSHGVFPTRDRTGWFWPDSWTHGAHSSYNLWEGNEITAMNFDGYWGSSSHNVLFRNRIKGSNPLQGLTYHQEVAAILIENNNHFMTVVGNLVGTPGYTNEYERIGLNKYWHEGDRGSGTGKLAYATGILGDRDGFNTLFRHLNYTYISNSGVLRRCRPDGNTDATHTDASEPYCQGGRRNETIPASLYLHSKPAWFGNGLFPPFDSTTATPSITDIPAKRRFNGASISLAPAEPQNLRVVEN